jgi:prepilin-type N-terminal cleavage/methylation domain-containing protein
MNNQKGVTLIELLVAIVILGIIIVPTLTIMTGTATRTVSQGKETSNAYLAQEVMEKIRINSGDNIVDRNSDGTERYYCYSVIADACNGHQNLSFIDPLSLRGDEIVEVYVSRYPAEFAFNQVRVVVTSNDKISYGANSGIVDKENWIELVTVVKR